MKTLILVRHAKSSWEFNMNDHDRPLNERGISDANLISKHLKEQKLEIDLVLTSDAERAKSTAKIVVANLNIDASTFHMEKNLYDFSGKNLVRVIQNCENSVDTLMIFGHNHAVTAFVNTYGTILIDNVPTCGVVIITFNIKDWKDLIKGETITTLFPKDFKK